MFCAVMRWFGGCILAECLVDSGNQAAASSSSISEGIMEEGDSLCYGYKGGEGAWEEDARYATIDCTWNGEVVRMFGEEGC